MTHKKNFLLDIIRFFFIATFIMTFMEQIYSPESGSGEYSFYIGLIILATGAFLAVSNLKTNDFKINLKQLLSSAVILAIILIWHVPGYLYISVSYTVIFAIVLVWSFVKLDSYDFIFDTLNIAGFIFVVGQINNGVLRPAGFLTTSATLFSFIQLVGIAYNLYGRDRISLKTWLMLTSLLFQIIVTDSRSTLAGALLVISLYILQNLSYIFSNNKWIRLIFTILMMSLMAMTAFILSDWLLKLFDRGITGSQSTDTRMNIINYYISYIISGIRPFFVGGRAGMSQFIMTNYIFPGIPFYPVHQDFIVLLTEYGLLGSLLVTKLLSTRIKFNLILILLLIIGSFHNLLLSPITVALLTLLNNSMIRRAEIEKPTKSFSDHPNL